MGVGEGGWAPWAPKIFRKFAKIFLRKLLKMNYFCLLTIKFYKPWVMFCAFRRKTHIGGIFWENLENFKWKFNWIIDFRLFLEKLMLKIEPSEITTFFHNIFFNFKCGTFPLFPLATPLARIQMDWKLGIIVLSLESIKGF